MARRVYPSACTSAFCGKCGDECRSCPDKPALDDFKVWVARSGATVRDPIWSPLVYESKPGLARQGA